MWILYSDGGKPVLINMSQSARVVVQSTTIVFYGNPGVSKGRHGDEDFETIIDLLEFETEDQAKACFFDILAEMGKGCWQYKVHGNR